MFKQFFFLLFFFSYSILIAQSSFKKLSCPEQRWVIFHPCKAKKALRITKEVQQVVDFIKQSGIIGKDNSGGKLDAFKHTFWMASLAKKIGSKQAKKLGCAHEKGNYLQFKKHQLEENLLPDSVSSAMDLKNNQTGIGIYEKFKNLSGTEMQLKVLNELQEGKLTIIKKDDEGNYLFCDGTKILMNEWIGKWNVPKCLVPSNEY